MFQKLNGEGQPTLKEFDKFISKFSDYIRKEIAGVRLGNENSDEVKRVLIYRYESNEWNESIMPEKWLTKYGNFLKGHFHTHPYGDHTPSKEKDIPLRNEYPKIRFFILAKGYEKEY